MINVPSNIKSLYAQDSISKNFRVQFPNGEYSDLVNKDLVSESVVFTESVSSDGQLRFGAVESPSIEFMTYFDHNLNGTLIFCCIEIDISSLTPEEIEEYGQTSQDVPYVFYRIPYGYFTVATSEKSSTGIRKIQAYSNEFQDEVYYSNYNVPEFLKLKLLWGVNVQVNSNDDLRDDVRAKFNMLELVDEGYTRFKEIIPESHIRTYQSNANVFNPYSSNNENNTPVLKAFVFGKGSVGSNLDKTFFVYVRGKKLIFGDDKTDKYSWNNLDFPIGNSNDGSSVTDDIISSKRLVNLPYTLSDDHVYELSWNNSCSLPDESDFTYPDIYEYIKDYLSYFASPCIIFNQSSTYPATRIDYDSTSASDTNLIFPVGHVDEGHWVSNPDTASYYYYPSSGTVYGHEYTRKNYRLQYIYEDYYGIDSDDYRDTIIKGLSLNERFVNLDEMYEGNNLLHIYPKLLDSFSISREIPTSEKLNYFKDFEDVHETSVERKSHIEIGIPTEIIIASSDSVSLRNPSQLLTSANPSIQYDIDRFIINDFTSATMEEYDLNAQSTFTDMYLPFLTDIKNEDNLDPPFDEVAKRIYSYSSTTTSNRRDYVSYLTDVYSCYPVLNINETLTNLTGKDLLADFAELQAKLLRFDRLDNNLCKFISVNSQFSPIEFPSEDIYPSGTLFPINDFSTITTSMWRKLYVDEFNKRVYNRVVCKIKINDVDYDLSSEIIDDADAKYKQYDISKNWYIVNGAYSADQIQDILDYIASELRNLNYYGITITMRGMPFIEAGDMLRVNYQNNVFITINLRQRISGIQSLIADIENK